ncbi:RF_PROK_I domain-containing protein [Meloidogyne graminicola]|uniref:RF_PROK_I domain-containing protein n=1 Tax=Meloidogyne graminicola TaxID=189291 RepID=A0A8S9ZHH0_9BILA|nr:RF_PROK_I domain-containing protein [Meloidogyne graminicola]
MLITSIPRVFNALKLPFIAKHHNLFSCNSYIFSIKSINPPIIRYSSTSSEADVLGHDYFVGLYFDGEIPKNKISRKWTKASGPGGSNINANPTKAEIRFSLAKADWLPEKVRERLEQKYSGNINSNKEFFLTSMRTRSAIENMDDCFEKLNNILKDVSLELVTEKRREYLSEDYLEDLEERKEQARISRIEAKERLSNKKKGRHIMISSDDLDREQQPFTITSVHYVEEDGEIVKNKKNQSKSASKLSDKINNSTTNNCNNNVHIRSPFSRAHRLLIMLAMTFFYFLIELIFGYVSHSMALIADSFHMMSDVMALTIAFGCLKIAERSRSAKNTFGWVRAEVLGALVNGVFLLALCFTIFIESIQRLLEPEPIKNPLYVLVVGTIGFLINLIGMAMFHGHIGHSHGSHGVEDITKSTLLDKDCGTIDGMESRHLLQSHQDRAMAMAELEAVEESLMMHTPKLKSNSSKKGGGDFLNMRAVFLHVLSDAVGSVIVIITALVSWLLEGYDLLKLYMDPTLSILLVLLMVCTTVPLVHETALILLQTTPKFVNIDELQQELLEIDGVIAVHEFHVWRLVGECIIATVHIRFRTLKHYILAAERIRSLFHSNHIHSTTIQPEFSEMNTTANNSEAECAFACLPNNCNVQESAFCCNKEKGGNKEKKSPPKKDSTIITIKGLPSATSTPKSKRTFINVVESDTSNPTTSSYPTTNEEN